MNKRKNILCLSGGGYLGLFTAKIIAEAEKTFGGPIAKHFDLIAGTSIGGVIALALAAEVPAQTIVDVFLRNGMKLFSRNEKWKIGRSLFKPRFDATKLETLIKDILGSDRKISELKHKIIIPAVNLTSGSPQIFKTPHHENFKRDANLKNFEVAMATSAAPTYFSMAEIDNCMYADGGLFANSPDLLALVEAENYLKFKRAETHVLSLGTTSSSFSIARSGNRHWGTLNWIRNQKIIEVMMATQQQNCQNIMQLLLDKRYVRIDHQKSAEQNRSLDFSNASKSSTSDIMGLAESTFRRNVNNENFSNFFNPVK